MGLRQKHSTIIVAALVGLLTSLVAAWISQSTALTVISVSCLLLVPALFYFAWPTFKLAWSLRGIRRLDNDARIYLQEMARCIHGIRKTFRYKGLTGHEFFSSKTIRTAFTKAQLHLISDFVCIFADPASQSYHFERTTLQSPSQLRQKHQVAMEYFQAVAAEIKKRNPGCHIDAKYFPENRNMLNMVVIDDYTFLYLRGFSGGPAASNQIVLRIQLSRCCSSIRSFILAAFDENFSIFSYPINNDPK